jgi:Flp pilus assembly protein TadD
MLFNRSQAASHWIEDFTYRVDAERIEALIDPSEEAYLYSWTRRFRPQWLLGVGVAGGMNGGPLGSPPSWAGPAVAVHSLTLLVLLGLVAAVSAAAFGRTMMRRAIVATLFGALIGACAPLSDTLAPAGLTYFASLVGGPLAGWLYTRIGTPWIRGNGLWPPAASIAGAIGTVWGTSMLAPPGGGPDLILTGLAGGCAALAFFTLLLMFFSHHFDAPGGLRDLAKIYAHSEATMAKAIGHLDEAIRIRSKDADLLCMRGAIKSVAGDAEGAEADYAKVRELMPKQWEPLMNRALDLAKGGGTDEALRQMEEALKLSPDNALIHCNLGVVHRMLEDGPKAIEAYDQAIALQPVYSRAYANRADALLLLKQWDRALADSEEAIRQNPRSGMAHVHRGQALEGLGRMTEARASFEEALRIGGEIGTAEEARQGLVRLAAAGA